MIKLNLGCGDMILPDYVNIDLYSDEADVKMDIRKLEYPDNYADEIMAIHVLEHVQVREVTPMFINWYNVLKFGGKVIIETPDLLELCHNFENANLFGKYRILDCIYGSNQPHSPHLYGWYEQILGDHLVNAGFKNVHCDELIYTNHWGYNLHMEGEK